MQEGMVVLRRDYGKEEGINDIIEHLKNATRNNNATWCRIDHLLSRHNSTDIKLPLLGIRLLITTRRCLLQVVAATLTTLLVLAATVVGLRRDPPTDTMVA